MARPCLSHDAADLGAAGVGEFGTLSFVRRASSNFGHSEKMSAFTDRGSPL